MKLGVTSELVNVDSSRPAARVSPSPVPARGPRASESRSRPSRNLSVLLLQPLLTVLLLGGCANLPWQQEAPGPDGEAPEVRVVDGGEEGRTASDGREASADGKEASPVGDARTADAARENPSEPASGDAVDAGPSAPSPAGSEDLAQAGPGEVQDPAAAAPDAGLRTEAAAEPADGPPATSGGEEAGAEGAAAEESVTGGAPPPLGPDAPWSERILRSLTLREKVGQMLMPLVLGDFAPEGTDRHDEVVDLIEDSGIGGVIVSVGSPTNVAVKLNDLQRHSRIPLLVASDLENGAGFRFDGAVHLPGVVDLGGATRFPPLMALGAIGSTHFAYEVGRVTATEARSLGIHVPFAPVLDVNNNPQNPVINVRAFGEDPEMVAEMGVSFVRGIEDHGALATGKHFPGHGDTATDSHVALPVILVNRERLESVELLPFRRAVAAGMGGIMTAHLSVPELTGSATLPATLSHPVITDLLRGELGFDGLVFTDAMNMGAVERGFPRGEAAVRAIEAGSDVVLMPPSIGSAQDAILSAIRTGRIDEVRIDASVRRILQAKERLGLHRRAQVSLDALPRSVGVREHEELATEIAERSVTLLRNERNLLPLLGTRTADVVSVTYRGPNDLLAGRHLDAHLRDIYPRLRRVRLDRRTQDEEYEDLTDRVRRSDLVVVSLYVSAVARDADRVLPDELVDFIEILRERRTPHIVVSFGNPYLISDIPEVQAYMLAWGAGEASQKAAARALFGDFPVQGRLPINIPPFFALGDGLRIGEMVERAGGR